MAGSSTASKRPHHSRFGAGTSAPAPARAGARRPVRRLATLLLGASTLLLGACSGGSTDKVVEGFVLPEGNLDAGRQVFVQHNCLQCHIVDDPAMPAYTGEREYEIRLGGEVLRVQDYGDLLTSVVLPDHRLSQARQLKRDAGGEVENSPMPNVTGDLTVAELIDLVSYLHSRYSESQSAYRGYSYVRD
jgi:mono/diheme cytochrome c family protein